MVQQELARSAAAVADRLAVRDRLRGARATLLARMQAVALGLEGLRAGLAEAESLSRGALAAAPAVPPDRG